MKAKMIKLSQMCLEYLARAVNAINFFLGKYREYTLALLFFCVNLEKQDVIGR